MARERLTLAVVENATCPTDKKDRLIFDRDLPGFGLRVGKNGGKIFLAQYNAATGKRRVVIGPFGLLTPEQARRRAKAILGDAAEGRDPFAEKRTATAAARAEDAATKAKAAEDAFSVRKLVEAWQAAREGDRRSSYLKIAAAALKRHFGDWLDRPASSITTAEVVRQLDEIKKATGPTAANRCLSYGRAAYGWAEKRQMIVSNPFRGVEAPSRERSRDRVLSSDEVGAIWNAADGLTKPYSEFVRVLLLTLMRREEVAGMRWAELDNPTDPTTWTLPAERSKNGKAHVVHLSTPVRELLKGIGRRADCPFVFPAESGKPVSAFSAAKRTLDGKIAAGRDEAKEETPALPGWTLHDFRRAGVTALAGMGFAPHVCDKLLNHISGTIKGVAAVYQRNQFLPERKAALDAWAAYVLQAAEGKPVAENVVTLHAAS